MHEVITLQLGQRSNFAATHFWNLQVRAVPKVFSIHLIVRKESYFTYSENEEPLINHDIHFRAGIGVDGTDTFTPRTVIYDLKGGFGSLRKNNALYEIQDDSIPIRGLWDGISSTQQQEPIEPSRYQRHLDLGLPTFQLKERDVRYWSDFNRVYYHPRSIVQLNEYELNSQLMPFENWTVGEDLYQSLDKEFDLLDRDLRPFAEECDQLQAIQLFATTDDAWGGFSSKYLDSLRDEYGKTSIWVWGIEDGRRVTRQKQLVRASNAARSLRSLCQLASAYIRLATPPSALPDYIKVTGTSEWLITALTCSAIESSLISTRLTASGGRQGTFAIFEAALNTNGRQNIFELGATLPQLKAHAKSTNGNANGHAQEQAQTSAQLHGEDQAGAVPVTFDVNFSPLLDTSQKTSSHVFSQIETRRHQKHDISTQDSADPIDDRMMRRLEDQPIVEIFNANQPFPLLDTFPDTLFHLPSPYPPSIAFNTALTTTARTGDQIHQLRNLTSRSIDLEEREAIYNDLTELADAYSHGWDSGSDSGDDE